MTKEEAIKILNGYMGGKIDTESTELYQAIELVVDILESKPPLPSNLDEAAEIDFMGRMDNHIFGMDFHKPDMISAFKAGAEWMAGQGYTKEETVYFERLCDENRIMVDLGWGEPERGGFNPGDKVVVQIRKK